MNGGNQCSAANPRGFLTCRLCKRQRGAAVELRAAVAAAAPPDEQLLLSPTGGGRLSARPSRSSDARRKSVSEVEEDE